MAIGVFQVPQPNPLQLVGQIEAHVVDSGGNPPEIVHAGDRWGVEVEWEVSGTLVPMLGGAWQVALNLDELGGSGDLVFPQPAIAAPLDAADGKYSTTVQVAPDAAPSGPDGKTYHVIVTVNYSDAFGAPAAMAGYVDCGVVQVVP